MGAWRAPKCSSGKHAYRSQGRALGALRTILVGDAQACVHSEGLPQGAHRCRECSAWHLTKTTYDSTVLPPEGLAPRR